MPETQRPLAITLQVMSIVLFTFIGYLNIGIALAVLPGYVHNHLGYGTVIAGLVISVQYLATLLSRPYASRIIDNLGSKRAVMYGLAGCGLSGVFMLLSSWLSAMPALSLASLLLGRLVLGSAESLVGSGSIGWGIGRVGAHNTAKVISWNGIASYGAIAIGAPLGVLMVNHWGMWSMGASIIALAVLGLLLAWPKLAAPIVSGVRLPFLHVLGRVLPHGTGLALGSIGFGTIATFITLYYATQHWEKRRAVPQPVRRQFYRCAAAVRQPDQPHRRLSRGDCLLERRNRGAAVVMAGPQPATGAGRCGAERFWLLAGIPGAGG